MTTRQVSQQAIVALLGQAPYLNMPRGFFLPAKEKQLSEEVHEDIPSSGWLTNPAAMQSSASSSPEPAASGSVSAAALWSSLPLDLSRRVT